MISETMPTEDHFDTLSTFSDLQVNLYVQKLFQIRDCIESLEEIQYFIFKVFMDFAQNTVPSNNYFQ